MICIRFYSLLTIIFLWMITYSTTSVATLISSDTYLWTDPDSGGSISIDVKVYDNFNGDYTKNKWDYSISNISFDPVPGESNGFSGFALIFPNAITDLANQFGPTGWDMNCCGIEPPGGATWDISNSSGSGILIGQTADFGFSTNAGECIVVNPCPFCGSFGYTYINGFPSNLFASNLTVPCPEPPTLTLIGLGSLLISRMRKERAK